MNSTRAPAAAAAPRVPRLSGSVLSGAGFIPVWIVVVVLLVVARVVAPDTLSERSFNAMLPLTTFLAVAALGEMLVIMTGGIDLSVPAVITMAATVTVGVSSGDNDQLVMAIVVVLAWSLVAGLVNGLLVGIVRLNPLIVTLATAQVVFGLTVDYRSGIANESAVPPALSSWAADRALGVTWVLWVGVAITLAVGALLRFTTPGRRFQAVGANPEAAWLAGIAVRRHQVGAYAAAGLLYGATGILLAAFIRNPTLDAGGAYLLGPIAAVVIAGASLSGGLASATSTWVAAFGLTVLSQMLRVLGLPSSLQFVVFGAAIAAGMVVSGERVVAFLARVLQWGREPPPSEGHHAANATRPVAEEEARRRSETAG